ncbi:TonB-dependent receptor [Lacibacter sp.]|uniref:SusC/RagA family TonB-linked outer membrane protein n=1 Tax=Lacibacter sp. TaxID=1915409 RepID=UPI002B4AF430|nr:TonB-dependent receptor [Lacibacter sp.]HLP38180.1 TonB-dependent receptor [Lacibacter sp.]
MKKRKTHDLIIRAMKFTMGQIVIALIFICSLYANDGAGQGVLDRTITINADNIEISKVIVLIKSQIDVKFVYSSKAIKATRKISVKAQDKKLGDFINDFFKPLGISYTVVNNKILLYNTSNNIAYSDSILNDIELLVNTIQSRIISGVVLDEKGTPLTGATVQLKSNKKIATRTDESGKFNLNILDESSVVLQISFVGFKTLEVTVRNEEPITVKLMLAEKEGEEVIVVGYGTQRKRDVTGSISRVSESSIKLTPVNSADQALQGRVAGVQVMQTSGAPGGAVQVRVRGVNSTAGGGANQPLYVVDGVPLFFNEGLNSLSVGNEGQSGGAGSNGASPLNTISPNDIESIEVLKDASATAIYGARAANGVVLITTKSGRVGKPQVSLNVTYGVQSIRKKIPMLNGKERTALLFEHRRNRGSAGNEVFDIWAVNPFLLPKGTDWQDEVFRSAPIANYNLAVNGGNERITYAISGDYMDQQGIVINTLAKRVGLRVNMDVRATDKLKFGTRTNISSQWDNSVVTDEFFQSELMNVLMNTPISPVRDANGNYTGRPNSVINEGMFIAGGANVVANLMERERTALRNRVITNIYGEYSILPSLKFKSSFGVDYLLTNLRNVNPYWVRGIDINQPVSVSQSRNLTFNWIAEQTLSFTKKFGEHAIDAVAGFSAQNINIQSMFASANGSLNNNLNQLSNNPTFSSIAGGESDQGLVSQFIRSNYSFKGKYLLTATVRRDGSSRFGGNNKYGIFPSASIGWRLSKEKFLENNKVINDLKIRASYGSTGNQEIGNFLFEPLMSGNTAVWGNSYVPGLVPARFPNPDIRWERNNQFDVGFDLSLWNSRVNITVDYYNKLTDGLLAPAPMSVISGVGNSFTTNIGKIRNSGFEFAINTDIIRGKDFTWNFDFNISTNKNEVVSLGDQPFINGQSIWRTGSFINRTQVGQPIGAFYLVQTAGQYLTWQEAATAPVYRIQSQPWFGPGDFIPVDQDKDGDIDDNDRVWSGSPFPDFFGGLTTSLQYKNWNLTVFAPFQHGNLIWNQPFLNATTFERNVWRSVYDNRWTPSNPTQTTSIPIPRNNNPIMAIPFYLQDGSFLRIRTISLSYDAPVSKIKFVKFSKIRLFVQANNFFVFTKYQGWDPEVNSFGSNVTTNGIDIGAYPQAKSVVFGLNLNF